MTRASSMALNAPQTAMRLHFDSLEKWLEIERDQIVLWLPVALGTGISLWFILPDEAGWKAVIALGLALFIGTFAFARGKRISRIVMGAGIALALGCAMMWARAEWVRSPVLTRPVISEFSAVIERVETQAAKEKFRLLLRPDARAALPPLVRVTVKDTDIDRKLISGDHIKLRARLVPPPEAAIPGGYNFARAAWFLGIGGTGTALGTVTHLDPPGTTTATLRERLSAHVRAQLEGSAGGIAAAFASGDRGGIAIEDEEAMRDSGLTHLLSISGLHITAVVAAAMFVALRILALSPWLALRAPLLVISAGFGAAAGIGYTLLTGAEVPTVRSCIAAVLVLIGLAIGREAVTLRLVATGALFVMFAWPESVIGASFQLSFAAITTIVALHDAPLVQRLTLRREEGVLARFGRGLLSLLLTGIAVEAVLAPIALFHFHKSGLYGALANIVAIPLTTFVIMPLEALALLFDSVGAGRPFWWLTGHALEVLLLMSRWVAAAPGAVASLPSVPNAAFALAVAGGLWLLLWKSHTRLWGLVLATAGMMWAVMTPTPDIIVTGDGKHMAVRSESGDYALLRDRAGDFVRDTMSEAIGARDMFDELDTFPGATCSRDVCIVSFRRGTRNWRIAATRSAYQLPWLGLIETCQSVDIIISDRRLPPKCTARWVKADAVLLRKTGGLAINLKQAAVRTVKSPQDHHPWVLARANVDQYRRSKPASLP